jgi:hypothetical protein
MPAPVPSSSSAGFSDAFKKPSVSWAMVGTTLSSGFSM